MDRKSQHGCQRQRNSVNEIFHLLSMPSSFRLNDINIQQGACLPFMAKLNLFPKALIAAYHGDNSGGKIYSEEDFFYSILDDTLQPDRK